MFYFVAVSLFYFHLLTIPGDLASKCFRLERENADLTEQNATFDVMKMTLTTTEKKLKAAELHAKTCEDELHRLKKELIRRDEVSKGCLFVAFKSVCFAFSCDKSIW
jgi:hypothetical protein